jgi:DNA-binding MarR family transcriptional regulator
VEPDIVTDEPESHAHPMAEHLGFLLRRVQLAVFSDFQKRTATFNLTPTEYSILMVIRARPDLQQGQLAEMIGVKPANCVALITGLEQRRLVDRRVFPRKAERGRALALRLTPDGKKLLKQVNRRVSEHQDHLIQLLGADAHEALRQLLLRLLAQAERGELG